MAAVGVERLIPKSHAPNRLQARCRTRPVLQSAPHPVRFLDEFDAFVASPRVAPDTLGAVVAGQLYGLTPDQLSTEFQPDGERSRLIVENEAGQGAAVSLWLAVAGY